MESRDRFDWLAQGWRERGVVPLPPAHDSDVVRTFAALDYPLSIDVRRLYTTVGGFPDFQCDKLWSFWSLDRLLRENERGRRPFVIFGDWLINSHVYCFHYESPEISSVYISHDGNALESAPIAISVETFFEKLLSEPDDVEAWDCDA